MRSDWCCNKTNKLVLLKVSKWEIRAAWSIVLNQWMLLKSQREDELAVYHHLKMTEYHWEFEEHDQHGMLTERCYRDWFYMGK